MNKNLKIAVGADHGGYELKQQIASYLATLGHKVLDCGTHSKDPVDYPRIAYAVAQKVSSGECRFGVMVDGAGIGSAMAANKVRGVRAAACYNEALARNSREHNDANLLTLGAGHTINMDQVRPILDTFLKEECTADRHLGRVRLITEIESGRLGQPAAGSNASKEVHLDLSSEDVERITQRVKQLLSGAANAPVQPSEFTPTPEQLAKMIDHTLLKPEASAADVQKLCDEALKHGFFSVCVNPAYVKQAASILRNSPVKVCCVVGFPLGAQSAQIKTLETRRALREGAREIDMVINIGALKSKDDNLVLQDIRGVVEACKESRNALCKVIIETSLLTDDEKVRACELSMKAGADFVKTSTGFSKSGATAEDIALMAKTVAPRKLGVKASGGVRTYADALKMIRAGATRVGSSNSIKMLEEARAASR